MRIFRRRKKIGLFEVAVIAACAIWLIAAIVAFFVPLTLV